MTRTTTMQERTRRGSRSNGRRSSSQSSRRSREGGVAAQLHECATVLDETFAYGCEQGEEAVPREVLCCIVDAAQFCHLAASFEARKSDFTDEVRKLCSDLVACAQEECEGTDDETLARCAEACRSLVDALA